MEAAAAAAFVFGGHAWPASLPPSTARRARSGNRMPNEFRGHGHSPARHPAPFPLRASLETSHPSTRSGGNGHYDRPAIPALDAHSFPILQQEAHPGKRLVYLDSAATSQKPQCVLDALLRFYTRDNANVHRGAYALSARATDAFEAARAAVAGFLNARNSVEVVFTRNATEAINTVAYAWGLMGGRLQAGDEILLTVMEHHANLVPWQMIAARTGAVLRHVPLDPHSQLLDMEAFRRLLTDRTKLVALPHVSNVLGSVQPVVEVVRLAHAAGARVLVDACQSVPHMPVDVQALDCDWLVASGHKMCAPSGIGILYGKERVLTDEMQPFLGGGEMIENVHWQHSTYAGLPHKFEAGTPATADAVALAEAVRYLSEDLGGMPRVHSFERQMARYLYESLSQFREVTVHGPSWEATGADGRAALCAFNIRDVHPNDISAIVDLEGIAIRSGHHCAQPLHRDVLKVPGSARASAYVYNSSEDIDALVRALHGAVEMLGARLTLVPL